MEHKSVDKAGTTGNFKYMTGQERRNKKQDRQSVAADGCIMKEGEDEVVGHDVCFIIIICIITQEHARACPRLSNGNGKAVPIPPFF